MDPNANLAEQNRIMARANGRISHVKGADRARLRDLVSALREWLQNGGFHPDWDACPYATTRYIMSTNLGLDC